MKYKIDTSEVLRYLGAKADTVTEKLIKECGDRLKAAANPRYVWKKFDLDRNGNEFTVRGTDISFRGDTAAAFLDGCDTCAMLGATLGIGGDAAIRRAQHTNMAKAVIYDACATDLIEKVCDYAMTDIGSYAAQCNMQITDRFSPGYGDFALEFQRDLCNLIDAGRSLGIYVTENLLLTPAKSVTAIVGIGRPDKRIDTGCEICNMRTYCKFNRKGGCRR